MIGVLIFLFAVAMIYWVFKKPKELIVYEKKLEENLSDEFIIDPETGTKLTLEEAESGHWVAHDNEFLGISEENIEMSYSEVEKHFYRAINFFKTSKYYTKYDFTVEQAKTLDKTNTLSKYDDWVYHYCFNNKSKNAFVFIPTIEYSDTTPYYSKLFKEDQLMLWSQLPQDFGHYYMRDASSIESILNKLRRNSKTLLKGYLTAVIKETDSLVKLIEILKSLENIPGLEIEVLKTNLFIKTRKAIQLKDAKMIDMIVNNL